MRIWFFCMIGILGLMGCKEEVVEDLPQDNDVCGAVALQDLVGTPIAEASFDESARILSPNSVVTLDHRPDRLNVTHDEDGIITRIYCG